MNTQSDWKVIEALEDAIEKARKNGTCLYPGCNNKPIGSHVIARKTLKLIAENSKVLTWIMPTSWAMYRQLRAGKRLEELALEPTSVGIHDIGKVTQPLFCHDHDDSIFAPIDKNEMASRSELIPEQVVLLAYRALTAVTYSDTVTEAILAVSKQQGYKHSLSEPERYTRLLRFQARDILRKSHQQYELIHLTEDYQQLGWSVYTVNVEPCVAATYSLVPADDNDAQAIVNGTQALTAEDFVSFTFLPDPRLNMSICVLSWIKESQRAQRLMTLNRVNELSDTEQRDIFLHFAFESPTIYISPAWWCSLSKKKREEYKMMHLNAGREHTQLV